MPEEDEATNGTKAIPPKGSGAAVEALADEGLLEEEVDGEEEDDGEGGEEGADEEEEGEEEEQDDADGLISEAPH